MGTFATLLRDIPYIGIYFPFYEWFKRTIFAKINGEGVDKRFHLSGATL